MYGIIVDGYQQLLHNEVKKFENERMTEVGKEIGYENTENFFSCV